MKKPAPTGARAEAQMGFMPWIFLFVQTAIVIASLLGYGIFTARPDLLAEVDPQAKFFVWAFHGFAVGNMLFGGLAVAADALLRNRVTALLAFIAVYVVSLASELLGTAYGVPFGPYAYTSLLGPKWFNLVPLLIPFSWFSVSWACWVIARHQVSRLPAILFGTALLIAWDLLLDPAMSKVTSYWIWGEEGSYYGMPWTNLMGWGVTGLVLFVILSKLAPKPRGTLGFALCVYAVNFSLPLGFCLLNGYWLATFAGVVTACAAWAAVTALGGRDILGRSSVQNLPASRRPA